MEAKMRKTLQVWKTFGRSDVQNVHAAWREARFEVQTLKAPHVRSTFGR